MRTKFNPVNYGIEKISFYTIKQRYKQTYHVEDYTIIL
jgi:hypothetical protein